MSITKPRFVRGKSGLAELLDIDRGTLDPFLAWAVERGLVTPYGIGTRTTLFDFDQVLAAMAERGRVGASSPD
jgi:hypothetical protein